MLKKARGKVVCREESDACVGNCTEKEKIVAIQERMLEAGKSGCIGEKSDWEGERVVANRIV